MEAEVRRSEAWSGKKAFNMHEFTIIPVGRIQWSFGHKSHCGQEAASSAYSWEQRVGRSHSSKLNTCWIQFATQMKYSECWTRGRIIAFTATCVPTKTFNDKTLSGIYHRIASLNEDGHHQSVLPYRHLAPEQWIMSFLASLCSSIGTEQSAPMLGTSSRMLAYWTIRTQRYTRYDRPE